MSEPIHIISLGAGVQSSTMALMAAKGEITPMPTCAIFADTGDEPDEVYIWLEWLALRLPFPVHVVSSGVLSESVTSVKPRKDGNGGWAKGNIPVYTLDKDGNQGHMQRGCTYDFKLLPLLKKQRELGRIKRGQKTVGVVSWIGISTDEASRMKDSREPWARNRYPLIEAGKNRHDCLVWMEKNGFPKPPRSACVYCPYHSNSEWRRLITNGNGGFDFAVKFEKRLQEAWVKMGNKKSIPFLHPSRKPLDTVDFSTEEERGQINMFNNECEGMCGV